MLVRPATARLALAQMVTLVLSAISLLLDQVIRPVWPRAPQPPGNLLPLFGLLSVVELLAFGLGMVFLAFGRALLTRMARSASFTAAGYLSVAWLLVSWWPQDNVREWRIALGFTRTPSLL